MTIRMMIWTKKTSMATAPIDIASMGQMTKNMTLMTLGAAVNDKRTRREASCIILSRVTCHRHGRTTLLCRFHSPCRRAEQPPKCIPPLGSAVGKAEIPPSSQQNIKAQTNVSKCHSLVRVEKQSSEIPPKSSVKSTLCRPCNRYTTLSSLNSVSRLHPVIPESSPFDQPKRGQKLFVVAVLQASDIWDFVVYKDPVEAALQTRLSVASSVPKVGIVRVADFSPVHVQVNPMVPDEVVLFQRIFWPGCSRLRRSWSRVAPGQNRWRTTLRGSRAGIHWLLWLLVMRSI